MKPAFGIGAARREDKLHSFAFWMPEADKYAFIVDVIQSASLMECAEKRLTRRDQRQA